MVRVVFGWIFISSFMPGLAWSKSIFILGSGNVGTFLFVALSKTNEVSIISQSGRTSQQIEISKESVEYINPTKNLYDLPLISLESIDQFPDDSVIFITVKAGDLRKVGIQIKNRLNGTQTLVFIQNGIGIMDESPALTSYNNKVRAMVLFGINIAAGTPAVLKVGSLPKVALASDADEELLNKVELIFESVGIKVLSKSKNVRMAEWKKAIHNIYMNGPTAVYDKTIGEILTHAIDRTMSEKLLREAIRVAQFDGVTFGIQDIDQVYSLAENLSSHSTTMREDLRNSRSTESPWLYGYMIKVANRNGLKIPATMTINCLISFLEQGFRLMEVSGFCKKVQNFSPEMIVPREGFVIN
jgi:2-dehydropantoate 2-reductase